MFKGPLQNGYTWKRWLKNAKGYRLYDIKMVFIEGQFIDHYDPSQENR
jgi:Zn-dependent membrane protease YugP